MELQFRSLSDVEIVEEINDNGHVLIEEDGKIKKVPKKEVGGVPTAILQNPEYPSLVHDIITGGGEEYSLKKPSGENEETEVSEQSNDVKVMEGVDNYPVCINMTFEEVYEIITSYQPINIIIQDIDSDWGVPYMTNCTVMVRGENLLGVVYLPPSYGDNCELYWSPDGLVVPS